MSCDLKNVGCGLGRSKTSCCLHEEQLRQRLGGWEKGDIWESGRGRKKEDPIGVKTRVSESSQQLRPQMAGLFVQQTPHGPTLRKVPAGLAGRGGRACPPSSGPLWNPPWQLP